MHPDMAGRGSVVTGCVSVCAQGDLPAAVFLALAVAVHHEVLWPSLVHERERWLYERSLGGLLGSLSPARSLFVALVAAAVCGDGGCQP